jgi:hypothetical protein
MVVMNNSKTFDNYPAWIVIISQSLSLLIYALGAYIISGFGPIFAAAFLVYCFFLEVDLLRNACVHCCYYGKVCGLGKGKLAPLLFKKGDPKIFASREVSLKTLLPNIMVMLAPLILGLFKLITGFNWFTLGAIFLLVILSTFGNGVARSELVCKFCKQKELGCPAEKMLNK